MMTEREFLQLWMKQLERHVYEYGSLVKGNQKVQADRIADVVEQIHDLSTKVDKLREDMEKKVQKIREAYRDLLKEVNGDS